MHLTLSRRSPPIRCALCHEVVCDAERCPECATAVHSCCLHLARRCPTLGCRKRIPVRSRYKTTKESRLFSPLVVVALWLGFTLVSLRGLGLGFGGYGKSNGPLERWQQAEVRLVVAQDDFLKAKRLGDPLAVEAARARALTAARYMDHMREYHDLKGVAPVREQVARELDRY